MLSEAVIERAMTFYASIGKKPIRLRKAVPGHVGNRLQAALYREVLYLIQQGVVSLEDADIAVSYGLGLRWGVMGPSLQAFGRRRRRNPSFCRSIAAHSWEINVVRFFGSISLVACSAMVRESGRALFGAIEGLRFWTNPIYLGQHKDV